MGKNKKIFITILGIVAIVLVIIGIVLLTSNSNKKDKNEENKKPDVTEKEPGNTEDKPEEKFVENLENGTKVNISDKIHENKQAGSYEFSNISLFYQDGQTYVVSDVKNNSSINLDAALVDVQLLNEDGTIATTIGAIISPAEAGKTIKFQTATTLDYANSYDIVFILK